MYFTDLFRSPDDSLTMLEELRQQHQLCDVTIKVRKRELPAHKVVLGATIPYFHNMFTRESFESEEREVTIKDIDYDVLVALIDFAYTGKIKLTTSNVRDLLIGSSFLKMDSVKIACCNFLRKRLNLHNVFEIRTLANTVNCCSLANAANHFVQRNFVEVAQSEEFLSLPLADVLEIIGWDELYVTSEEQVFNAAMNWVKRDPEGRREMLTDLFLSVRVLLLNQEFLAHQVQTEELIQRTPELHALSHHMMREKPHPLQNFKTTCRSCPDDEGCIYVVSDFTNKVEKFDRKTGCWEMSEPMPKCKRKAAVASTQGKLYVIGGKYKSAVEVFDPETQKWSSVASMNNIKGYTSATTLYNKIYACGRPESYSKDEVECYDPECDKWTVVSPMRESRSTSCIVASRDQIYVIGGNQGMTKLKTVESYEPQSKKWCILPPMLTNRWNFGAAVLKGKIYVCGGQDSFNHEFHDTMEVYDPATRQWKFIHSMNAKRSEFALVSNGGLLYAIGGHDSKANFNTVEVYDMDNDRWTFIAPMCALKGSVKAGVIYEY